MLATHHGRRGDQDGQAVTRTDSSEHPGNADAAKADLGSVVEAAPKLFGAAISAKIDLIFTVAVFSLRFMSDVICQIQKNLRRSEEKTAGEALQDLVRPDSSRPVCFAHNPRARFHAAERGDRCICHTFGPPLGRGIVSRLRCGPCGRRVGVQPPLYRTAKGHEDCSEIPLGELSVIRRAKAVSRERQG